jgi:hypothetical protein
MVEPVHTLAAPVIEPGAESTAINAVSMQPVGTVNVIIVVPTVNPVTIPEPVPTVATPGAELIQVPNEVGPKVVDEPTQIEVVPVITGKGLTVIVLTALHPEVLV